MKPAAILAVLLSPVLLANDWPHFRGPNQDNTLPEAEIVRSFPESGPKILWKRDLDEGYGGAAIVGDEVYLVAKGIPNHTQSAWRSDGPPRS